MSRLKPYVKGDKNCVKCSGTGLIDGPMIPGFNVSRMEVYAKETKLACECATVEEPDWDSIRKAKKEA